MDVAVMSSTVLFKWKMMRRAGRFSDVTITAVYLPHCVRLEVGLCFFNYYKYLVYFYSLDFPFSRKKGQTFSTRHSSQTGTWERGQLLWIHFRRVERIHKHKIDFCILFGWELQFDVHLRTAKATRHGHNQGCAAAGIILTPRKSVCFTPKYFRSFERA